MSHGTVYICSPRQSQRLSYVANWLSEAWRVKVAVVSEMPASSEGPVLSYGGKQEGALFIPDQGLLWESGIRNFTPETGSWEDLTTFFPADSDVPFDLFSAIFFLLSRYEEYLPFTPDAHGRYPATESMLFKTGLLRRPIVDLWLEKLQQLLNLPVTTFQRRLTYDIDRAWQIKNWPAKRQLGLWAKALLKGSFDEAKTVRSIAKGQSKDPLDAFDFLEEWHRQLEQEPIFFVLAAQQRSGFDVNLPPEGPAMRQLMQRLSTIGTIGVHPSYLGSEQPQLIAEEKKLLEKNSGTSISYSRQHFIRLRLPQTYSELLAAGITDDFSMGYGSHLGFRAGTGRSFLWYNLKEEREEQLRIHPFPFMDTAAHFYEKLGAEKAFSVLKEMEVYLKKSGSVLTTVFHNYSLGTDPAWEGWQEAYRQWLAE